MSLDHYAAAAGMYDLVEEDYVADQDAAVDLLLGAADLRTGPVLDIGCGSGRVLERILDQEPLVRAIGLEPSDAMRSLALGRLAAEPARRSRVTVRPEGALEAPLPDRLAGVIMLGVLGHFPGAERRRLWTRLAPRLRPGGAMVLDMQAPERPEPVPDFVFADTTVGDLRYRGTARGEPLDGETMHWWMTYQTLDGEQVLEERTAEHFFCHPAHATVRAELAHHGLDLTRIGASTYWLATP